MSKKTYCHARIARVLHAILAWQCIFLLEQRAKKVWHKSYTLGHCLMGRNQLSQLELLESCLAMLACTIELFQKVNKALGWFIIPLNKTFLCFDISIIQIDFLSKYSTENSEIIFFKIKYQVFIVHPQFSAQKVVPLPTGLSGNFYHFWQWIWLAIYLFLQPFHSWNSWTWLRWVAQWRCLGNLVCNDEY